LSVISFYVREKIAMAPSQVPVTVLTGFLGSGKTTLLNHILTAQHGRKIAVIENEFGEVSIDDALLERQNKQSSGEAIVEMMNGCICCTVRQDLVVVLKKLAERHAKGDKLDAIVIETTGLADPAPVAQTFFVDEDVSDFCKLDGIVTLIDAKHINDCLDREKPEGVENEAVEQIAFADRLIVNKTDLVDEETLVQVEKRIKGINKFATVIRSHQAKVSVDQVLNIGAFDLERTLEMDPEFLNTDAEHEHDESVTSVGVDFPGNLDMGLLKDWLGKLMTEKGQDLYRMKGVLAIESQDSKYICHAVHMLFEGEFTEDWKEDEKRGCKLIFIGKDLDHKELRNSIYKCIAVPGSREKRLNSLRFKEGDKVECRVGPKKWVPGNVIERLVIDQSGQEWSYKVDLGEGRCTVAPCDDNQVIRKCLY
jgi:G3E family GTPase